MRRPARSEHLDPFRARRQPCEHAHQLSPCFHVRGRTGPTGDQEARNSICAPSPSAARDAESLRRGSWWRCRTRSGTRRRASLSASISQDHATSASSGSTPMSGSSGACAKHTMRHGPLQATRLVRVVKQDEAARAVHRLARLRTRDARRRASARASGASPAGAAISLTVRSSRNTVSRTPSGDLPEGRRQRRGTMLGHADRLG